MDRPLAGSRQPAAVSFVSKWDGIARVRHGACDVPRGTSHATTQSLQSPIFIMLSRRTLPLAGVQLEGVSATPRAAAASCSTVRSDTMPSCGISKDSPVNGTSAPVFGLMSDS